MHTCLGKIFERITNWDMFSNVPGSSDKARGILAIVLATRAAHFVVDDKLLPLIQKPEVRESFKDMVRYGIRALPFDPMLIEWRENGFVNFVRLSSKPLVPPINKGDVATGDLFAYPIVIIPGPGEHGDFVMTGLDPREPLIINWGDPDGRDRAFTVSLIEDPNPDANEVKGILGTAGVEAMALALLMLNNNSVEREHVETGRLNKTRMKNNKLPIPSYTVLKIGKIYDRAGKLAGVGSGVKRAVHWRCAHVRQQRYGHAWEKVRPILIPATLVNFDPLVDPDKVSPPKHEVTT